MLKGIDVSSYQAPLAIGAVDLDFVIIKATGGTGYVNPVCDTHYQQAKYLGKLRGVYHYYSDGYGGDDPVSEANWFVDNIQGYVGDAILVLDWERGGNPHVTEVNKAKAWLDQVFARTGVRPIIYMSLSLIQELDWSSVIQANYGLWCAYYILNSTPIYNFGIDPNRDPNPTWDGNVNDVLWQFSSSGQLDGYAGDLDCNFFYGDSSTWDAYAGAHSVPPPPATAPPLPVPDPPQPTPIPTPSPEPTPPPIIITPPPLITPKPPRKPKWWKNLLAYLRRHGLKLTKR